ncbi:glycosyltransferase [Candidatus Avelusimicrobium gallicola]|uniref:Glycosyltransferase 2-like domain-containing protein n=1 Tax=Candidatus Avelusimicrobium gallicola TaxID=2562704 RepID=A0A1Y4DCI9_9BACT|nr:glycosyltransferase [Elusimicrobium sp. An273]OUO56595.1 hypothetical protein B5F75_05230 [Elusimicrobium sp. An273]
MKKKNKSGIKSNKTVVNRTKKAKPAFSSQPAQTTGPAARVVVQNHIGYTPKVSVIIPVYNVETYLRECLDSVVNQTLKEIEIICVDDGSTDHSLEILKEYAAKDSRITVLAQPNCNAGKARNEGLAVAKAPYVGFVDSDDYLAPDMYQKLYDKALRTATDICICEFNILNTKTQQIVSKSGISHSFLDKFQVNSNGALLIAPQTPVLQLTNPAPWNKIYSKQFLNHHHIQFQSIISTNDLAFTCTALCCAKLIALVPEALYYYRTNTCKSLTDKKDGNVFCFYEAIQELQKRLEQRKKLKAFFQSFLNASVSCYLYNFNKVNNASKDLLRNLFITEGFARVGLCKQTIGLLYFTEHKRKCELFSHLTSQPAVSILMPIYNVSQYLKECLDSVINQTLKNIEIICINDGSTDNSLDIIKQYAAKDVRIRYIDKPNAGYGQTINCGLNAATGEYIGIVEPDDFIEPEMYETLYTKAKEMDLDIIKSDYAIFTGEKEHRTFTPRVLSNNAAVYNHITNASENTDLFKISNINCNGLYKRSFINENHIRLNETPGASFQDNGFWFQTFSLARRICFIKGSFYMIRRDNPNSSVKSKGKVFCMCDEAMFIHKFLKRDPSLEKKFMGIFWNRMFGNYLWTMNRIAPEFKQMFLSRFRQDFKQAKEDGELNQKFFSKPDWEYINKLINGQLTSDIRKKLSDWYQKVTGKYLNLDNPRTFNEKTQWLKLYDSTPLKTRLADKYLVREWIKEKIGEQYLIPLIGVYDKFDDIDFDKLPNQFVMKCNHGSGWNIIVKDKSKLNLAEAKQKIDTWMATDYSTRWGFELHYRNIVPKIIIEKYMEEVATALYDYRFFCSYGDVKQIWLDVYSGTPNHKRKIYDRNWNELNITVKWPRLETPVEKPQKLADMIRFAEILSKEFSLVRVDFYLIGNHIYFGEMTFTSMSGIGQFNPEKEDLKLGNMIKLPALAYNLETGEYYKLPKKSRIKPYVFFPYYLCKKFFLNKQKEKYTKQQVRAELSGIRLDIKNVGQAQNAVEIYTTEKLSQPAWFSNAQGQGQVLESCRPHLRFNIKAVHPGKLSLVFRGKDRRFGKERIAAWVDYTSIKINGKELLPRPVPVWHDKPFRYEMPVKDGQTVQIELWQHPHKYSRAELKDLVLKLFAKNDYVKAHVEAILKDCSAFIRPEDKRPARWFSVTNTGVQKTVYILGLKLTVQNKQAALRQLLQQQQALLQAVQAASGKNNALEQRYAALASQLTVVQHEVQQAKLWIKQTYEAFPTVNKQLSNAQDALLSQLVTEKKVNRLAAITSVELKKQRKHNQEMKQMLSKFVADTQVDLRYLRNMDVAKNERLQQASKQLSQQMRELFQKQDEQLADMQTLLASGENTLQHLKGIDVAEAQHLKQTEEELTQRIAEAAGAQSELLSSVSAALRKQQEEGLQKTGNLYLSLEALNKAEQKTQAELQKQLRTLQDKSLRQYHELNFADLLHDSTRHSLWLKDKNFSLYGWAANYSFIYTLFRILDKVSPRYILEMGLGQTTRLTSQYVAYKNPAATLDVCEHNQNWIDLYTPELPHSEHIHVHHLELEYFDFEGKPNDKYKDIAKVTGNTKYNLIIVDGPVGGGKNFPRSNIVDLVPQNLAEDFIIIFDDAERAGEQKTIEQTKARLAENGIVFATQQRNGAKSQFLIFSQSMEFVQYL